MKVLFDHQIFDAQTSGGISRYFNEIIAHFNKSSDVKAILPPMLSNNIYIQNNSSYSKINNINTSCFSSVYKFFHPNKMKKRIMENNRQASIDALKNTDYDIFHPTYYNPYFLQYLGNRPFVLTIHDMTYAKLADTFPANDKTLEQMKIVAEKANMIIAVSENTKNDVMKILKIPDNRIEVIYHGNSIPSYIPELVKTIKLPDNYLLFIGRRKHYKNFEFFISSIAKLLLGTDLFLICVGGSKFSRDENKLFKKLKIKKHVLHFYPKTDNGLAQYYARAKALCFPSKYEGFGLPILEAFANNCPVIASNTSSLPEIAGEAAIYFDPNSSQSITDAIKLVLTDKKLRENIINLGRKQLEKFSWQKTALATKHLYYNLVRKINFPSN